MHKPRFSKLLSKKVLLSLAAVGTAGAMAGLGTFAAFTSTTSASNTATSGKVIISVGADLTVANRFSVNSGTLVPGDTVQRSIDLISTSTTGDLGGITLTTTASPSSLLDTDASAGLKMELDNCVGGTWTESGTAPAYTYSCTGGIVTSILPTNNVAVIGSNRVLSNLGILTGPTTDHLRLKLTLPGTTGNTFQDQTSTILYTFNATQRGNLAR